MTTNQKGAIAEAKIIARLAELGEHVLVPYGRIGRYDIVLDRPSGFVRIECKRGRVYKGCITFHTSSRGGYGNKPPRGYLNDADIFAVWCPETDKVYMIPVCEASSGSMCLRVENTKNGTNMSSVKWAADYEATS